MSKWLKVTITIILMLSIAVMGMVGCAPAAEKAAAEFYQGKTINCLIGYSPGGGFDIWARALAPYIAKHTGANVIVENKPGAGGRIALNYLYKSSAPDGLTIEMAPGAGSVGPVLLGQEGVEYDLLQFKWLGNPTYSTMAVQVATKGPYQSVGDLMKATKPVKIGVNSKTTSQAQEACAICKDLGINAKMVVGYKGTANIGVAVLRGEVDVLVTSATDAQKQDPADLKTLFINAPERLDIWPEAPTVYEATGIPKDKTPWMKFRRDIIQVGRPYIAPPNTPEDLVNFLREAIRKTCHDEDFLKKAAEANLEIIYRSGEDQEKLVKSTLSLSAAQVAEFKHLVLEEFYK